MDWEHRIDRRNARVRDQGASFAPRERLETQLRKLENERRRIPKKMAAQRGRLKWLAELGLYVRTPKGGA